jgi:hypothetical protein
MNHEASCSYYAYAHSMHIGMLLHICSTEAGQLQVIGADIGCQSGLA